MTISYTPNFNFPLADDACENHGAIFNGVLEDLDAETKASQTPIMLTSGELVVVKRTGELMLKRL
jgi:hypothetical protein